jgi:ABC-type branched-subunit amino acid transport system ATPase component
MSTARKILDWHKQGSEQLAQQLQDLPEGRYVLLPENETLAQEEELVLTDEQLAGLAHAFEQADRGETLAATEVYARIDARLQARLAAAQDKE